MKRTALFLSLIMFFVGGNTFAYDPSVYEIKSTLKQMNILDESELTSSEPVSREECITAIMRSIGVTDENINSLNGADYYTFADVRPYSYMSCAYAAKIAYGEECVIEFPTYRSSHTRRNTDIFFFPARTVTLNETLAFMVRCLHDGEDFNKTMEKAKEYSLINDDDDFINDPNDKVYINDLCVLLNRMLQKERYKFYSEDPEVFCKEGFVDEQHSMTYLQMLLERR